MILFNPNMKTEKLAVIGFAIIIIAALSFFILSQQNPETGKTYLDEIMGNIFGQSTSKIVEEGDCVDVDYTGRFCVNDTVFDTSYEEIAQQEGLYTEGRPYEPLKIFVETTGAITPPDGYSDYYNTTLSMLPGFVEGLIGATKGETKTITLSPEEAYGAWNETLAEQLFSYYFGSPYYPRYVSSTINETVTKDYLLNYNSSINLSAIYVGQIIQNQSVFTQEGENASWEIQISDIDGDNVTITNLIENNTVIRTEGLWDNTIIVENETMFGFRADATIGGIYGGPYSYMQVIGYNDTALFIEMNMQAPAASFVNQTINFEVEIKEIYKTSNQL